MLSVSMELIVIQFVDSLSTPSMDDGACRLSSHFCEPESVSRFEFIESVLELFFENFVAFFLPEDRCNMDLLDVVESAPALDGLGLRGLKFLFVIESIIYVKKRQLIKIFFFNLHSHFYVNDYFSF